VRGHEVYNTYLDQLEFEPWDPGFPLSRRVVRGNSGFKHTVLAVRAKSSCAGLSRVSTSSLQASKAWMAGSSPAKTKADAAILHFCRSKIFPGQPWRFRGNDE
jgi:hypothetical protein